jgi:hypothetical protein
MKYNYKIDIENSQDYRDKYGIKGSHEMIGSESIALSQVRNAIREKAKHIEVFISESQEVETE